MSLSFLEDNQISSESRVGMVTYDNIGWETYRKFDREESFLEYSNHTIETIRQLLKIRLMDLQVRYYNDMIKNQNNFLVAPNKNRDEILTIESRKRGPDNSLQFERKTKVSRPSTLPKLLNGFILKKVLLKRSTLTLEPKTIVLNQIFQLLHFFM